MGSAGRRWCCMTAAVGYLPGAFTVAAASSVNLIGSMRSLFLKGLGTGWVTEYGAGGVRKDAAGGDGGGWVGVPSDADGVR